MFGRKFIWLFVILVLWGAGAIDSSLAVHAQDDSVRFIPVTGRMVKFELSPDGQTVATFENHIYYQIADEIPGEEDLLIRLININTGDTVELGTNNPASDVVFSPDGAMLASYHLDGYIYLWDVTSGAQLSRIPAIFGGGMLEFLPDGKTLLSFSGGMAFFLWDIDTGHITDTLSFHPEDYEAYLAERDMGDIYEFAVSPDGTGLVFVTMLGAFWYWDLTGEQQTLLKAGVEDGMPPGDVMFPRFMPDGGTLTYWDRSDSSMHIADPVTGIEHFTLPIERGASRTFAFSPDGATVAWADRDTIYVANFSMDSMVIDPIAEYEIMLPNELAGTIGQLVFSPDSSQIIAGGFRADQPEDNRLYIVDLSG